MAKRGRPSKYKDEFAEQAQKLCELGATDKEIGDFFNVSEQTINAWKEAHPQFLEALKAGKAAADDRVERSLYHKAIGYTFDAVKIFMPAGAKEPVYAPYREHVAPDTTACIFWLKNRRKEQWRDKLDHEHGGRDGKPIEIKDQSRDELARAIAGIAARIGAGASDSPADR